MRKALNSGAVVFMVLLLSQSLPAVPGDTVKSIPAPFSCPQGLTFDGKQLWNADRRSDMIYGIDPGDGSVVDSLPTPGYVPRGLTWDGQRLWCVDAEEELIYAINPTTQIVEKTIYCPVSRPTGLAWDGRYLWLAADRDDEIHQISSDDGTTIVSIPAPTSHAWGLTFDGTYLWVSDRYKDMIYMVTPDNGDVIVCFDAPGPHSCGLAWDGSHLWNVDYQTDLIYQLAVDDGTPFARLEEKTQQVEFIHQVRNFGPDTVKTLDVYLAIPENQNNQELLEPVVFDPELPISDLPIWRRRNSPPYACWLPRSCIRLAILYFPTRLVRSMISPKRFANGIWSMMPNSLWITRSFERQWKKRSVMKRIRTG